MSPVRYDEILKMLKLNSLVYLVKTMFFLCSIYGIFYRKMIPNN